MTNKFVTLLDKLGHDFKLGVEGALAVEARLLPAEEAIAEGITVMNPVLGGTIEGLLKGIIHVEQVANGLKASSGNGQEKLAVALPAIEQAVLDVPMFHGRKPANLELWNKAALAITGSLADLINSYAAEPPAAATP